MLHEILLSLSGHPSPLLRTAAAAPAEAAAAGPTKAASKKDGQAAAANGAPAQRLLVRDGHDDGDSLVYDPAGNGAEAAHDRPDGDGDVLGLDLDDPGGILSPPERALLAPLARLADLYVRLSARAAHMAAAHPSAVCRAVCRAINEGPDHLAAFQRTVLAVEAIVLRRDAGLVGAYEIVSLTAVVGEFDGWTRRMEWLWEMVQFMTAGAGDTGGGDAGAGACTGSNMIDRLRSELRTGYADIGEAAMSLVRVAEIAWLKQVSAWILYGRLPSFGADSFFVRTSPDDDEDFICDQRLLPSFVTPYTASSMLFVGKSLSQIRVRSIAAGGLGLRGADLHLSSQLKQLALLTFPLEPPSFSHTIAGIRQFLSRTILQRLLPLSRVLEMLHLLRDFFLLGRGEFAMVLIQQAGERIQSRWKRADNLAYYQNQQSLGAVAVKDGEVSATLAKTWAALGSLRSQFSAVADEEEDDEGLERARDLLRLTLDKSPATSTAPSVDPGPGSLPSLTASTPFRNLLFSVPVVMTFQIPSPVDLFLTPADLQTYSAINAYLLSIRRAHIRLTALWKMTPLRRQHPAPPPCGRRGGKETVRFLRERSNRRAQILRSTWATASAAVFFLSETETYLQTEVVAGLWEGFRRWLIAGEMEPEELDTDSTARPGTAPKSMSRESDHAPDAADEEDGDDIWLATSILKPRPASRSTLPVQPQQQRQQQQHHHHHDPQTLSTAHRLYLSALVRRLLLARADWTEALYALLVQADRLASLVRRLHAAWQAADLESDAGVMDDALFRDAAREERECARDLADAERCVRDGAERLVEVLRGIAQEGEEEGVGVGEQDDDQEKKKNKRKQKQGQEEGGGEGQGMDDDDDDDDDRGSERFAATKGGESEGYPADGEGLQDDGLDSGCYVLARVGGVDRLLMKLDFGSWFGPEHQSEGGEEGGRR